MADNETTADIIAAMRDEAARADMEQECSIDDAASAAKMMREFARRFEAAHKREMRDAVTNCNQFGNAAKLRESLEQVQKKINYLIGNLTVSNSLVANRMEINGIINAALAAPPRNCDLARDWMRDLYAHFKPPASIKREMPPEWVDAVMAFCRWLVAPAKEKKGGDDGNE